MIKRIFLLLSILSLLGGCETYRNQGIRDEFNSSSQAYNSMIRWDELESAQLAFPDPSMKEEYGRRVEAATGAKITDYRVRSMECFPEKGEATVTVEFEYYREPSLKAMKVRDVQKWKYVEENGRKRWRLMSLLPVFP